MLKNKKLIMGLGALWSLSLLLAPSWSYAAPLIDDDKESTDSEEEKEEEEETWVYLAGGDVYTGTGAFLRGAGILCHDDKIEAIGFDIVVPEDAEVLNIEGYSVYPGLIALSSRGLFGGNGNLEYSVDPFSDNMLLAVAGGITVAVQGTEIGRLNRGRIEDVVVGKQQFTSLSYSLSNPGGRKTLREKFDSAETYLRAYRTWEGAVRSNKELKEPKKTGVDSHALAVLRGTEKGVFRADIQQDLLAIARLAQRYGFRPVIQGCREGWLVAAELGRAGATAIVEARDRRNKSENLVRPGGSSIENAAILHRHGVQVAVAPGSGGISMGGIVGRDIMHMPVEAAFAVRGGLAEDVAIASMTVVPARLLGLEHRLGTIEVGKDADLIITDGDILHYKTFVQWSVIGGRVVYDKEAELYLAHIRPRPVEELAPEVPVVPGERDEEIIEAPKEETETPVENPEEAPVEEPAPVDDGGEGPPPAPEEPPVVPPVDPPVDPPQEGSGDG